MEVTLSSLDDHVLSLIVTHLGHDTDSLLAWAEASDLARTTVVNHFAQLSSKTREMAMYTCAKQGWYATLDGIWSVTPGLTPFELTQKLDIMDHTYQLFDVIKRHPGVWDLYDDTDATRFSYCAAAKSQRIFLDHLYEKCAKTEVLCGWMWGAAFGGHLDLLIEVIDIYEDFLSLFLPPIKNVLPYTIQCCAKGAKEATGLVARHQQVHDWLIQKYSYSNLHNYILVNDFTRL
jgi:hypothetical protein